MRAFSSEFTIANILFEIGIRAPRSKSAIVCRATFAARAKSPWLHPNIARAPRHCSALKFAALTWGHPKPLAEHQAEHQPSADAALLLSLAWIDAHIAMLVSCVRQQQAEEGLFERGALLHMGRGGGWC
jgi:hypothetical protein